MYFNQFMYLVRAGFVRGLHISSLSRPYLCPPPVRQTGSVCTLLEHHWHNCVLAAQVVVGAHDLGEVADGACISSVAVLLLNVHWAEIQHMKVSM